MSLEAGARLVDMVFASRVGVFARFAVATAAYVAIVAPLRARLSVGVLTWVQVAVSVALLAVLATPVVVAALVAHALVFFLLLEVLPRGPMRTAGIVGLLISYVLLPVLWFPMWPAYTHDVREFVAFATNAGLLRAWAWARDRPRLPQRGAALVGDYALYTFFLPTFPNGPFFSPVELERRRLPGSWGTVPEGASAASPGAIHAIRRILMGVVAVAVATTAFDAFAPPAFEQAAGGTSLQAWWHALRIYVGFYLAFTAWTEVSIGSAVLAGMRLPENFDRPHTAYGLADFWRRWNATLGRWMLQYVYLPLAPRGGGTPAFAWYGTAAVFWSVAVYHYLGTLKLLGPGVARLPGFWIPWALWAILNTVGVRLTQTLRPPGQWTAGSVLVPAATVALVAFGMTMVFFPLELSLGLLRATLIRMVVPT